jgi:hypothetical protein
MDVHQLLRQKESELSRLYAEVESLRVVLPLLLEETDNPGNNDERPSAPPSWAGEATGTAGALPAAPESGQKASLWSRMTGRREP